MALIRFSQIFKEKRPFLCPALGIFQKRSCIADVMDIRYVDDIKANIDNIATLMVEDIRADKINMRKKIQESLDRLVSQNYIARNGDTYTFLTDDEQDIEREIRNTPVDITANTRIC